MVTVFQVAAFAIGLCRGATAMSNCSSMPCEDDEETQLLQRFRVSKVEDEEQGGKKYQLCRVTVCSDDDFKGTCDLFRADVPGTPFSLRNHRRRRAMDAQISSVSVGEGCAAVTLNDDDVYDRQSPNITESDHSLDTDLNNDVSSILLYPKLIPTKVQKALPCIATVWHHAEVEVVSGQGAVGNAAGDTRLQEFESRDGLDGTTVLLNTSTNFSSEARTTLCGTSKTRTECSQYLGKLEKWVTKVTMTKGCAYVQLEDDDGDAGSAEQNHMMIYPNAPETNLPYDFIQDVRKMVIYQNTYSTMPLLGLCPVGYVDRLGSGTLIKSVIWSEAASQCKKDSSCCGLMQSDDETWRRLKSDKLDLVGCDIRESSTFTATCVKQNKIKEVCDTIALGTPMPTVTTASFVDLGPGLCLSQRKDTFYATKKSCAQKCWVRKDCKGYSADFSAYPRCHLWLDSITGSEGCSHKSGVCSQKFTRCFQKKSIPPSHHPWRFANWGVHVNLDSKYSPGRWPTGVYLSEKRKASGAVERLVSSIFGNLLQPNLWHSNSSSITTKLLISYATEMASSATDLLSALAERTGKQIELLASYSLAETYGMEGPNQTQWGTNLRTTLETSTCRQQREANDSPPAQLPGKCNNSAEFEFYETWYKGLQPELKDDLLKLGFLAQSQTRLFKNAVDLNESGSGTAGKHCFKDADSVANEQKLLLNDVAKKFMANPALQKHMYKRILYSANYPELCQWVTFLENHGRNSIAPLAALLGMKSQLALAKLTISEELGFDAQAAFMDLGSLFKVLTIFQDSSTSPSLLTIFQDSSTSPSLEYYKGEMISVDKILADVVTKMTVTTFIQQLTVAANSVERTAVTRTAKDVDDLVQMAVDEYGEKLGTARESCKELVGLCEFILDLLDNWATGPPNPSLSQRHASSQPTGNVLSRVGYGAAWGYLILKLAWGGSAVLDCSARDNSSAVEPQSCDELEDTQVWLQYSEEIPMAALDVYDSYKQLYGSTHAVIREFDALHRNMPAALRSNLMKTELMGSYTKTLATITKKDAVPYVVEITLVGGGGKQIKGVTEFKASQNKLLAKVDDLWQEVDTVDNVGENVGKPKKWLMSTFRKFTASKFGQVAVKIASRTANIALQYFCLTGVIGDITTMIDAFEDGEFMTGIWAATSALGGVIGLAIATAEAIAWAGIMKAGVMLSFLAGPLAPIISMVLAAIGGMMVLLMDEINPPSNPRELGNELCCYAARLGFDNILQANVTQHWNASTTVQQCEAELILNRVSTCGQGKGVCTEWEIGVGRASGETNICLKWECR